MKKLLIAALSAGLILPTVVSAAELTAPGKPAGVRAAQDGSENTLLFIGLGVAAAVVIGIVASSGGGTQVTVPPATSTT
jgi:hypothetical protein